MTTDEARDVCIKFVEKWSHIAIEYCWKIDVCYHGQAREMPSGASDALGFSHGRYHYLQGGVHFNLELLADKEEAEIEEVVVHEFCHFLIFPMQNGVVEKDRIELCVTMIARTLLDVKQNDSR